MTKDRRQVQPFNPPKAGDAIRQSHFRHLADGVNTANEYQTPEVTTRLRWAITCGDGSDDAYPEPSDFPNAFPFKWVYLRPTDTATFPIRDTDVADDDFEHSPNVSEPDGYVMNRAFGVNGGFPFDGTSTKVLSYIPKDSLILVGHSEGHYWVASHVRTGIISATSGADIAGATSADLKTNIFPRRTPAAFSATLLLYRDGELTGSTQTFAAYNEWLSGIDAHTLLKLSQDQSGRWVVVAAECGGPIEGSGVDSESY